MGRVTSLANVRGVADIAEIEGLIRTALPGSDVSVEDMAGGDHLYAHVVNGAVDHLLGPGRPIHALKIKTEATQ